MTETTHHGSNLRSLRRLQGIKQQLFAKQLGVSQQAVSKLEKRKKISPNKLKDAAKVLGVTVDAIENFQHTTLLYARKQPEPVQTFHAVKDVIDYFKEEIGKRDKLIEQLRSELDRSKSEPNSF